MKPEASSVLGVQEAKVKVERISLVVVTIGLVITACNGLASRSKGEAGSAVLSAVDFVVEMVMIVLFAALVFRALNRPAPSPPSGATWMWVAVGVVGALASLTLVALRTERALAQSPARLQAQSAARSEEGLPSRMNELMTAWNNEIGKMATARAHRLFTGEVSPGETFTREEVREHRESLQSVTDLTDVLINACRQAEARELDAAPLGTDGSHVINFFVASQRVTRALLEQSTLIDQHWEEWQSREVDADKGSSIPWRKELLRLDDEIKAAQKDRAAAKQKLQRGRVGE